MSNLNNNLGTPKFKAKLEFETEKCREEGKRFALFNEICCGSWKIMECSNAFHAVGVTLQILTFFFLKKFTQANGRKCSS